MWKEISKGRIQKKADGFYIIKPANILIESTPLFCPICKSPMKNCEDSLYFKKWKACYDCSTTYAEPNRKKWEDGWRPNILIANE